MPEEMHIADLPPYPGSDDNTGARPERESITGAPRWVKVFGIVALVLVLLVGCLLLISDRNHGPGRHTSSGDAGGRAPLSGIMLSGDTEAGDVRALKLLTVAYTPR